MNVDIIQACTIGDTQSVIEGLELQMDNDTVALAVQAAAKNGHTACVAALLPFYPAQVDDGRLCATQPSTVMWNASNCCFQFRCLNTILYVATFYPKL